MRHKPSWAKPRVLILLFVGVWVCVMLSFILYFATGSTSSTHNIQVLPVAKKNPDTSFQLDIPSHPTQTEKTTHDTPLPLDIPSHAPQSPVATNMAASRLKELEKSASDWAQMLKAAKSAVDAEKGRNGEVRPFFLALLRSSCSLSIS